VRRLLVTVSVVPSSLILVTLIEEALRSSETSVLTRTTRRNIPDDALLYSHRRENFKSYTSLQYFTFPATILQINIVIESKGMHITSAQPPCSRTTWYLCDFNPLRATRMPAYPATEVVQTVINPPQSLGVVISTSSFQPEIRGFEDCISVSGVTEPR
jgi:hypothetical protein